MNFFNKITDFLFPKKEPTAEEISAEELQELAQPLTVSCKFMLFLIEFSKPLNDLLPTRTTI